MREEESLKVQQRQTRVRLSIHPVHLEVKHRLFVQSMAISPPSIGRSMALPALIVPQLTLHMQRSIRPPPRQQCIFTSGANS
ncbi:hypothetical protein EYF80_023511 [Liparis tanakae]|uniref:Uncharacterized protein n=1 Tax=Liparis tanakae TaxID=230148 RepID=A0A4Z2HKH5_9TELE|nr:hypothetical protein EYF80_023511 [Liparis tanakae]